MNSRHWTGPGLTLLALLVVAVACRSPRAPETAPTVPETGTETESQAGPVYELVFEMTLDPDAGGALAELRLGDGARAVRELRLKVDPALHLDFDGGGRLSRDDGDVVWDPPAGGGSLTWFARLEHERSKGAFDALITDRWALFRGGDVFPPAAVRTVKDARSDSRLVVNVPSGWEVVTPYASDDSGEFPFENPERGFDRPTGWIIAGHLGIRRAFIADTRVAIAAPEESGLRRMDMMAFLYWNLPTLREIFPDMPGRIVLVGADDPMWRGGLSGPDSLYVHADRPMISENGTSTLLHELVHVAMGPRGSDNDDWIVEGIAEYYSMRVLYRSGTLGYRRTQLTREMLEEWGEDVDDLFVRRADGPVTARAAILFSDLAREIKQTTGGSCIFDNVAQALVAGGELTYERLREETEACAGAPLATLAPENVPGAPPD